MALEVRHLHHQHGVMRRHSPAAFRENVRVRQLLAIAELLEHPDHGAGVFINVVVDRAGIARVRAIVVDTEAATHIDMIDRQPERTQLGVITNGFTETVTVVRQVGNLRAHVEVQQPHALLHACGAEALDNGKQLRSGKAELGLLTPRVSPLARSQRRKSHAQANLRDYLQLRRFLDDHAHFRHLLDDDEDVVTELLPHQRQADEFTVLVAVADDGAALRRQRQHGHQLRLGASFEADRNILRGDDVLDHRLLLVDLDRVQRGVLALVFEALDIGIEGTGQMTHTVLKNVREAHQQRQGQPSVA